jgi:hypothetical protein
MVWFTLTALRLSIESTCTLKSVHNQIGVRFDACHTVFRETSFNLPNNGGGGCQQKIERGETDTGTLVQCQPINEALKSENISWEPKEVELCVWDSWTVVPEVRSSHVITNHRSSYNLTKSELQ